MPRFSVVVPAYNAENTLVETLEAIRSQLFRDWECIVVNDGSLDGTGGIADSYALHDSRFRVISQRNSGSAGAYNSGVSEAKGKLIVMCSADDILLPDHMAKMSEFITDEIKYDIYSTNGFFWRSETHSLELVYPKGTRDVVMSLTLADVIERCFYSVGTTYKRNLFFLNSGYRNGVFGEDYDFWLRAMAKGARHRYMPNALSLHRVSACQKSADREREYQSDIRLITDLVNSSILSPNELQIAKKSIAYRKHLAIKCHSLRARTRFYALLKSSFFLIFGKDLTLRLIASLRSRYDRRQMP